MSEKLSSLYFANAPPWFSFRTSSEGKLTATRIEEKSKLNRHLFTEGTQR